MFEKTIGRTEMIDHSFERKFYGACYRLYKNVVRWFNRAQCAHKVLKWECIIMCIVQCTLYHCRSCIGAITHSLGLGLRSYGYVLVPG